MASLNRSTTRLRRADGEGHKKICASQNKSCARLSIRLLKHKAMPRPKANDMAPFQDARRRKRERVLEGARTVRRFSALMIALHVVAFCLTLQLSGIAHLVIDLWLMGDAAALHAHGPSDSKDDGEDCPDEGCPPGCPSCHCTHIVPMLPVLGEAPLLVELPKLVHEILLAYEMRGPPSPDGLSIYRPPRFQA